MMALKQVIISCAAINVRSPEKLVESWNQLRKPLIVLSFFRDSLRGCRVEGFKKLLRVSEVLNNYVCQKMSLFFSEWR
jgi:hypothetical protein